MLIHKRGCFKEVSEQKFKTVFKAKGYAEYVEPKAKKAEPKAEPKKEVKE